jgi:disulfide bond formation protein DsbB
MTIAVPDPTMHSAYKWGALALFLAAATILAALGFEHLGGIPPCPLCLEERYAYYAGVPLLFLALILLSAAQPRSAAVLFLLVALAFLGNAALGTYHAGAEWRFWPGPASCTGAQDLAKSAGGLLDALSTTRVVRCDEAAWRFLGVSLAGWNAVVSLFISAMSLRAATESLRAQ